MRETSVSVGKTVRLITEGEHTEADATIVDALFEPLLHVLRNALDHGIESPEQRASLGKPAMGTLVLRGLREGENVHIEVEDDGGGIDVDRVRAVAGARGVAPEEALAAMTDGEVIDLIFAAGFSTAATVTDLSGRGVGMDSVRTAVERLGGTVTLQSRPRLGTTVSLILPFSLMMTRVMTVEVAGQMFGLPLDNVVETTIVGRDVIIPIGSTRAFLLRDRTIPLVDLADILRIARDVSDQKVARVVIVSAAGQIGAIEVDRLGERLDVMLKPMEGLLGGMRGRSGNHAAGRRARSGRAGRTGDFQMTVVLHDANTIRLIGACPAEDGETLLQQLLANPMAQVDWRGCESAHAAVIQVLLVSGHPLQGPPAGQFLQRFIGPAVVRSNCQV